MGVTYINPYRFAAFSPLDLSPALWLDASDAATITSSGGKVSQWNNKGTLGNFTQGVAANQPTTGASTLNGLNVLDFVSDFFISADAASAYNALHNGTNHIMCFVWKAGTTSNPAANYFLLSTASGSGQIGMAFDYDDVNVGRNNFVRHFIFRGSAGSFVVSNSQDNSTFTPNTFHVMTVLAQPTNATAADRSAIVIDNNSALKNNAATNAVNTGDAAAQLRIGALSDNTLSLTGAIAEIVIVTGANATEANRAAVHTYLKNKWGL